EVGAPGDSRPGGRSSLVTLTELEDTPMECQILRDEMMDVLYGEADEATRRRVDEHHALCAECRDEMAALRSVRRELSKWSGPEKRTTRLPRPGFRLPHLAAAAALLVAAGAALGLSGSELSYREGRFAFRLGRADKDWQAVLAAQEASHEQRIRALQA